MPSPFLQETRLFLSRGKPHPSLTRQWITLAPPVVTFRVTPSSRSLSRCPGCGGRSPGDTAWVGSAAMSL